MCNRVKAKNEIQKYAVRFDKAITPRATKWKPSGGDMETGYGLPTLPVIMSAAPAVIGVAQWGLVPYWVSEADAEEHARKCLNARSEGLETTPSFKDAWKAGQRCICIADAFYENRHEDIEGKKTLAKPLYSIWREDEDPVAMAGVYTIRKTVDGTQYATFAIITVPGNTMMKYIHNYNPRSNADPKSRERMPVILNDRDFDIWLSPAKYNDPKILAMIRPYPDEGLGFTRLSEEEKPKKPPKAEQGDLF